MNIGIVILAIIVGAIIGWLTGKIANQNGEKQFIALGERYELIKKELDIVKTELKEEREKAFTLNAMLESSKISVKNQETKVKELESIREKFMAEFENISAKLIRQNTDHLANVNNQKLKDTLFPLGEQIKQFESKIERSDASRNQLKGELNKLFELNQKMSTETQNLTKALKGDRKTQGNWGEFILEKVLENSGLIKDREYRIQVTSINLEGATLKPDVVINLPDEKHLIIDSKVSLVSYEKFVSAHDNVGRKQAEKELIVSLRSHINSLSKKNYHDIPSLNSPDFVLLFIPIEAAFSLALETDSEIYSFAWQRKVVLVSPTTLLATLRTVASIWKQERQTQNALKIAVEGGKLYDKFVGFVTDMDTIGKSIGYTQKAYNAAMNKLSEGRGNLVKKAEELKKMGANATKQLSKQTIMGSEENEKQE